jgi:hypothetical protein
MIRRARSGDSLSPFIFTILAIRLMIKGSPGTM